MREAPTREAPLLDAASEDDAVVELHDAALTEAEVLEAEARVTAARRRAVGLGAKEGLGVCFSGGGVRAASFDCGVLWKLAELGLLKEVDHLAAVSGGGYAAAAFVTHVRATEVVASAEDADADAFYRGVCARLVIRMQENIGYLVTTGHSLFRAPGAGRGSALPRIFDVPTFVALLIGMPAANILSFLIFWAVPLVAWVNLNHGHSMRSKLCGRSPGFFLWAPTVAIAFGVGSLLVFVATSVVVRCKVVGRRPPRYVAWLNAQAVKVASSRLALVALVYTVLISAALGMESYDFGRAVNRVAMKCACARFYDWDDYYASRQDFHRTCTSSKGGPPLSPVHSFAAACVVVFAAVFAATGLLAVLGAPSLLGLSARTIGPLVAIFGVSYVAQWRVFGPVTKQRLLPGLLVFHARLWATVLVTSSLLAIARLPSNHELPRMLHRFYADSLRDAFFADATDVKMRDLAKKLQPPAPSSSSSAAAAASSSSSSSFSSSSSSSRPDYQTTAHTTNPLASSSDDHLVEGKAVKKETQTSRVPNLILGCTVNEFRRPDNESKMRGFPFVITSGAWGGKHTGYAPSPRWLGLSRAMAVSGAAIDGFVLMHFKSKALRLGLQLFNLTMGDTLRFSSPSSTGVDVDDETAPVGATLAFLVNATHSLERYVGWWMRRSGLRRPRPRLTARSTLSEDELAATWYQRRVEMPLFALVFALFATSGSLYVKQSDKNEVIATPSAILAALAIALLASILVASAWTHAPRIRVLLASPFVNQVHLLLNLVHYGTRAPPFVTLTDGGLTEGIGVVELLRRRLRWVVVVDTSEDPHFRFRYLKEALATARTEGLLDGEGARDADPDDPRPLDEVLSPRVANRPFERLHATYPGGAPCDLFLVKMRAPHTNPRCDGDVEPLVKPTEVAPAAHEGNPLLPTSLLDLDQRPPPLKQNQINGLCCECCHATCRCLPCGTFPFISVGNQFLTPLQFANLCRLARNLSDAPLRALVDARGA